MAFGSIAVSFCGTSFKVHWLNDPTRLLCSQVFLAPIQYSNSNTSSYSTASSSSRFSTFLAPDVVISDVNNSVSDTMSLSSSMSISENVDLPLSLDNNELRFVSQMSNEESSGYSSEPWHSRPISSTRSSLASIFSDVGSQGGRKMSFESSSDFITDYGRFNRRILKNLSTSFENVSSVDENPSISTSNFSDSNNTYYTVTGATNNVNGLSDGCILKLRRNSDIFVRRKTTSGDALSSNTSPSHNRSKRPRLAIAVSITLNDCSEQDLFCSEHMVLLESMLHRVKFAAEQAYVHRQKNLFNLVSGEFFFMKIRTIEFNLFFE
jgi:folliculin-interacting protein 2